MFSYWCPGGDSNSHAIRRYHLKIVCLPIPPPGHSCSYRAKRRAWQAFFFIPANFCILPPVVGPLSAAPSPLRSFPKAGLSPQPASSARPVTDGEDRCARRTVAPPSTHPPPPEALGRVSMRSGRLRQRKGTPPPDGRQVDSARRSGYSVLRSTRQGTGRRSRRQPRQVRKEATVTVVAGCPVPKRAQPQVAPFCFNLPHKKRRKNPSRLLPPSVRTHQQKATVCPTLLGNDVPVSGPQLPSVTSFHENSHPAFPQKTRSKTGNAFPAAASPCCGIMFMQDYGQTQALRSFSPTWRSSMAGPETDIPAEGP